MGIVDIAVMVFTALLVNSAYRIMYFDIYFYNVSCYGI